MEEFVRRDQRCRADLGCGERGGGGQVLLPGQQRASEGGCEAVQSGIEKKDSSLHRSRLGQAEPLGLWNRGGPGQQRHV